MKKMLPLLASVVSLAAAASSSLAQCSSLANLQGIGTHTDGYVLDQWLDETTEFVVYVTEEAGYWFSVGDDYNYFISGTEATDGSFAISVAGSIVEARCADASSGGVVITVTRSSGSDIQEFAVTSLGSATAQTPQDNCPCVGNGNSVIRPHCTVYACRNGLACKQSTSTNPPSNTAWCTPGSSNPGN